MMRNPLRPRYAIEQVGADYLQTLDESTTLFRGHIDGAVRRFYTRKGFEEMMIHIIIARPVASYQRKGTFYFVPDLFLPGEYTVRPEKIFMPIERPHQRVAM